jgi:neutral ceramidase
LRRGLLLFLACAFIALAASELRAGAGRVDITPDGPIWLSGYGDRTHPSTGVLTKLWAKALAMEDSKGGRVVIVTTDLIGLPRTLTDPVAARIAKEYSLERSPRDVQLGAHAYGTDGPVEPDDDVRAGRRR